ncbi:MAG: bifunctional methylenetetrahydrofolate dehydrogenase/methenyltetrahydrofolate cyclohydrolase FolD [Bdellovibrionales bacterium]|nr:bifunctional methylenetetrahydrofolate dehydrogenase/methenyltetrahydrofolate cyclohydrolase FolD [Bdellovibrionales bacterium]
MTAHILDGKALAAEVQRNLTVQVENLTPRLGRSPGLAVVLVGNNPASEVYVRSKSKKAKQCGIAVTDVHLPSDIGDEALQRQLRELSARADIDGILLQLPLPKGLNEFAALQCIDPSRDADGLHPYNQGLLLRSEYCPQPCTPKGSMALIDRGRQLLGLPTDLSGQHAVVVGRSILVGKPMALLLLDRHCTVSVCHSRTKDLVEECRRADILVAAVGRERILGREHVKPGAIVIDVGINRTAEGTLVGDVDFEAVRDVAGAITPVPGGVGPMTIAMLLQNTVDSAQRKADG